MMQRNLLLAFVACVASFATAQNMGRITGTVFDEHGQVTDGATVCLSVNSGSNSTRIDCLTTTDHGQFQMPKVGFGTYSVFAISEAQGYSMENQSPGERVTVSAANPAPDVTVRLRPGGAILTGTVRDKVSGEPVKGITVRYMDVDGGAMGSSGSPRDGEVHATLPTDRDLVIVIFARGYKGWVYTDPSSSSRPVLRLSPGEQKQVDVQLEPAGS